MFPGNIKMWFSKLAIIKDYYFSPSLPIDCEVFYSSFNIWQQTWGLFLLLYVHNQLFKYQLDTCFVWNCEPSQFVYY